MESIPEGLTEKEKDLISDLCFTERKQGTLLSTGANLSDTCSVKTSKSTPLIDLYSLGTGIYSLFLDYAQSKWPDLNLVHERDYNNNGTLFLAKKVARHLDFVKKNGIRFGSTSSARSDADRYVLVKINGNRVPCQIEWLVQLQVPTEAAVLCAVVSPFVANFDIRQTPWDL